MLAAGSQVMTPGLPDDNTLTHADPRHLTHAGHSTLSLTQLKNSFESYVQIPQYDIVSKQQNAQCLIRDRQPQRRPDSEKGSEKEGGKGCGLTLAGDFLGRVPTFGS